jgi:CheY-like chemotaxis protein
MSHEIRTPMNAILGFSELLNSPEYDENKKRDFVHIIQSRGNDLMHIIKNLVEVSKIESGEVQTKISMVVAESLITKVFERFEGTQKSEVTFKTDIPTKQKDLAIYTDPTHLNRVLSNLVENAIKYTDEGKISLGYYWKENECTFFVRDSGIGIHPDKSSIIFNRFMQAEVNDPQARGGNGLGLTIAKDLIEILEGKIWFESEMGKGTSFFVSVPVGTAKEINTESLTGYSHDKSVDWSDRTLLVAEDDVSNYMVLKHFLDPTGIKIQHVKNGLLALDAFKSNGKFDMILMDMKMPLMNGVEATRVIRKLNQEVPIVALTASAKKDSYDQFMEAGCNEYLNKPLKHEELIRIMTRYL